MVLKHRQKQCTWNEAFSLPDILPLRINCRYLCLQSSTGRNTVYCETLRRAPYNVARLGRILVQWIMQMYLLPQGVEECKEFQEIKIGNYSYDEFSNCMQHYSESGWFMKGEALVAKCRLSNCVWNVLLQPLSTEALFDEPALHSCILRCG